MSDERLRAAFADLRQHTEARVSTPPAALILRREHRRARGETGRAVALAGVSAVALVGAVLTLHSLGSGPTPEATRPAGAPTPPTLPAAAPTPTPAPPHPTAAGTPALGTPVASTPAAPRAHRRAPTPAPTRVPTRAPSAPAPSPAASPRTTEVIVYVFGPADAIHPCGTPRAVERTVLGDGGAETALRALLDGATPSEIQLGLRSAFTPAVGSSSTVTATGVGTGLSVDLGDSAALRAVAPVCRTALVSSAIASTATANHGTTPVVTISGSLVTWALYLAGL